MVARRAIERREQYRQVRAHVRKEDGRLQAYGWSLPGKVGPASPAQVTAKSNSVPVPVPVYCRPLAETTPGMKIWCAAGVNLMGGHTKDGGLMVGGSVFYYSEPILPKITEINNEVETLDEELEAGRQAALLETRLSSLVWICTSTQSASMVTVIDANNPAAVLDNFTVCDNHLLCIASVAGASSSDYTDDASDDIIILEPKKEETVEGEEKAVVEGEIIFIENAEPVPPTFIPKVETPAEEQTEKVAETEVEEIEVKESETPPTTLSSVLATMWLGTQNGELYVHSSVANWRHCLHSVKLPDAVLSIV